MRTGHHVEHDGLGSETETVLDECAYRGLAFRLGQVEEVDVERCGGFIC